MAPAPSSTSVRLEVSYSSTSGNKNFSRELTTTNALQKASESNEPAQFSKDKTAFLSELRSSVKQVQGEINVFLTEKMEGDKKRAATNGHVNGKAKDEVEEENYGEENVEED